MYMCIYIYIYIHIPTYIHMHAYIFKWSTAPAWSLLVGSLRKRYTGWQGL